MNAREAAARQKAAELEQHRQAALVMQKWFRGWQARKVHAKRIKRTKREIEEEYEDFASTFKANDSFNLNRFLKEKQRLRAKTGTDVLEEDTISEHLGEQSIDAQAESYIRSNILASQSLLASRKVPVPMN